MSVLTPHQTDLTTFCKFKREHKLRRALHLSLNPIFGVSCKPRPQYWSPCTRCQQTLNLNPGVGRISPPPISTPLDVMPQFVPFGQPLSPEF